MTLTSSFLCHRLLLLIISFFLFLHTHTCFFVFSSRHVVQNSQVWSTFCWVLWCIHFHTSIIIQIRHLQCHFILFVLSFILIQNERRTSTFDLPCCRLDPFDVTYYHFYTNTPFFRFFRSSTFKTKHLCQFQFIRVINTPFITWSSTAPSIL